MSLLQSLPVFGCCCAGRLKCHELIGRSLAPGGQLHSRLADAPEAPEGYDLVQVAGGSRRRRAVLDTTDRAAVLDFYNSVSHNHCIQYPEES